MSDYSDIFLAMGLSAAALSKVKDKKYNGEKEIDFNGNIRNPDREMFLRFKEPDLLEATAMKYSNGLYNPSANDNSFGAPVTIVSGMEGWNPIERLNLNRALAESFVPRDNYIHSISSPTVLQSVYRSVFGNDADFRMVGLDDKKIYLDEDSACPNHFYNFLGRAKIEIAKFEHWRPIHYSVYRYNYNPALEAANYTSKLEREKFLGTETESWLKKGRFLSLSKTPTYEEFYGSDYDIRQFSFYKGDFSNYINDDALLEPWEERELELFEMCDQLLDAKYATMKKANLLLRYKKIFTKRFVFNSRSRLITMWDFSPLDYPDKPEKVREMAIRSIARFEGWKPTMCKTEVIPPYEWAMFVPTETGECKRVCFDGTNEFEVPYTWRDFPISNLLYWPERMV